MTNKLPQVAIKCILDDVLKYEQPTKYIVKSTNYDDSYNTPVLTAGKSFIIGYTNETEGICNTLPVIIFDDFTTSSQYVDFPFKVKSSAMKILHATDEANIKYLYYLMQTIQHKADTHKRYWISEYSQREINLPSKSEQNKIVEKIEEEFWKIDECVEKLKLAQEQIKQYRQSVLKSAFDGELYKTTEWEEKRLKQVCDVRDGTHDSPKYIDKGYPLITSKNLKNNKITYDNIKYVSENDYNKINERSKVNIGDVLFAMIGTIGNPVVVTEEPQYAIKNVALFKPTQAIDSHFLKHYLETTKVITKMGIDAKGSTQKFVPLGYLRDFVINLPTIDEQKQIVKEIEKRFEVADEVERVITENLEKAEQLKQSILKKAFEGRLVPQDPTDQPASELLAQIKAERKK